MSINDSQTLPTILISDATISAFWIYEKLEEKYPKENIISIEDHRWLQNLIDEIADKTYDIVLAPMPLDQWVGRSSLKTPEAIIDYVRNKLKITVPIVIVADRVKKEYRTADRCLIWNKEDDYSALIQGVIAKQQSYTQKLKNFLRTLFPRLFSLRKT